MDKCYICSGDLSEGLNQETIDFYIRSGFKMAGTSESIKGGLFSSPKLIHVCYFCGDGIKLVGIETKVSGMSSYISKNDLSDNIDSIIAEKEKLELKIKAENEQYLLGIEEEREKENELKKMIIDLLTKKSIKMTTSDITAHIKHDDRDEVKSLLEEMHEDGDIDFAGSGRYFIYSEKKKPKKATAKVEKVDIEKELEKYKGLLDKGLIEKEDFDAKKKELLGL